MFDQVKSRFTSTHRVLVCAGMLELTSCAEVKMKWWRTKVFFTLQLWLVKTPPLWARQAEKSSLTGLVFGTEHWARPIHARLKSALLVGLRVHQRCKVKITWWQTDTGRYRIINTWLLSIKPFLPDLPKKSLSDYSSWHEQKACATLAALMISQLSAC